MRDYGICKPGPDGDEGATGAAAEKAPSALEPRFVLMPPVVVTTGIPKTPPAVAAKQPPAIVVKPPPPPANAIPLPRLRPLPTADAAQQALASSVK
jgi:hypothetical protein